MVSARFFHCGQSVLAAAARTELPDDIVFEAILFPFDALKVTWLKRPTRRF
jgi:hypothetical protein